MVTNWPIVGFYGICLACMRFGKVNESVLSRMVTDGGLSGLFGKRAVIYCLVCLCRPLEMCSLVSRLDNGFLQPYLSDCLCSIYNKHL